MCIITNPTKRNRKQLSRPIPASGPNSLSPFISNCSSQDHIFRTGPHLLSSHQWLQLGPTPSNPTPISPSWRDKLTLFQSIYRYYVHLDKDLCSIKWYWVTYIQSSVLHLARQSVIGWLAISCNYHPGRPTKDLHVLHLFHIFQVL